MLNIVQWNMLQITTKSKYGQSCFEVFDKCLGWLLAFMQHLQYSVWSSTVFVGTLRPSLSSGIPYQCMCCSKECLHCNRCSIVWHYHPCRLWFLAFPPPQPQLQGLFLFIIIIIIIIITIIFHLLTHFIIHVFLHSAIWLQCDSAHRGLGVGCLWMDCGLGRPVWCSSTSGYYCGFSPRVSRAHSLHLC